MAAVQIAQATVIAAQRDVEGNMNAECVLLGEGYQLGCNLGTGS